MLYLLLVALLAAGHIVARMTGHPRLAFWLKPLPVLLVALMPVWAGLAGAPPYRWLILAGLLASVVGDVLLALEERWFTAGLAAFLVAHLLYIGAFLTQGAAPAWWVLAAVLLYGGLMLGLLWPRLPASMRLPVGLYVAVILTMLWLAVSWRLDAGPGAAGLAALGALFFAASDSVLAWDRFHTRLRLAPLLVMSTYYLAQALLALSAAYGV